MLEPITIGWFQVENLLLNRVTPLILDLRRSADPASEPRAFFSQAKAVLRGEALSTIQQHSEELHQPVLLVCDDGRLSLELAMELGEKGYVNIFVVEGGAPQLAAEFHSSRN